MSRDRSNWRAIAFGAFVAEIAAGANLPVVFASGGMWLNQAAFQAGELKASLPALDVGEQVVAAVIGVTVLREKLQAHGALDWLLILVALGAMVYGVVVLAVRAAETSEPLPPDVPVKPLP